MADEGIKFQNQIRGITDSGEARNIRTNDDGSLKVSVGGGIGSAQTDENGNLKVAVITGEVETTLDKEKVLASGVKTIGTSAISVTVNGNVTVLMFANYAEEADVTLTIGEEDIVVAAGIALEIPINTDVTTIRMVSTAADTKVYYLAKGTTPKTQE